MSGVSGATPGQREAPQLPRDRSVDHATDRSPLNSLTPDDDALRGSAATPPSTGALEHRAGPTGQLPTHLLRVVGAEPTGRSAIRLQLEIPNSLAAAFRYTAGQHVKISRALDGTVRRRSFSLCTGPTQSAHTGRLVLGVREIPDGHLSSLLCSATPEWLSVSAPHGTMVWTPGHREDRVLLWGIGSGVTAILGIADELLRTTLAAVDVVLIDRSAGDAMLTKDLHRLVDAHPGRLRLTPVWTREPQRAPFDAARVADCLATLAPGPPCPAFVCGPTEPVELVRRALLGSGYDNIQFERFDSSRVTAP